MSNYAADHRKFKLNRRKEPKVQHLSRHEILQHIRDYPETQRKIREALTLGNAIDIAIECLESKGKSNWTAGLLKQAVNIIIREDH